MKVRASAASLSETFYKLTDAKAWARAQETNIERGRCTALKGAWRTPGELIEPGPWGYLTSRASASGSPAPLPEAAEESKRLPSDDTSVSRCVVKNREALITSTAINSSGYYPDPMPSATPGQLARIFTPYPEAESRRAVDQIRGLLRKRNEGFGKKSVVIELIHTVSED